MKRLNLKTLTAALAVAVSVALPAAAQEASGPILFTNVNVFDGVNEALIKNAYVVVTGNKITAVSTKPLAIAGGTVIDGGGRTLMPGLTDCHWHSMAAYMVWGRVCGGFGQVEPRGGPWRRKDAYAGLYVSQGPGRSRIRAKRGDRRGSVRWSPDLRCRCDDLPNVGPCRFP